MGQKFKLQSHVHTVSSPNTDGFYRFCISQGSVSWQLRCDFMFSNHFITNLTQNASVKNFENQSILGKDMDKSLWLTFLGHPVINCK